MPLINNYTHYTNRGIVYIYTKQVPTYITTSQNKQKKNQSTHKPKCRRNKHSKKIIIRKEKNIVKQKTKVEIKTKIETKPIIYINLFRPPYVISKTITYEKPYLQITIPFK